MSCIVSYSMNSKLSLREERDMSEFYTQLHERLIIDVAGSYGSLAVKQESIRDIAVLRRRVRSEGISFLTKTLPKLGKALDKALSQGTLFAIQGFVTKPRSALPKFLGWLLERVFSDQGEELSESSPRAVRDLRQILYFLYKLELPYTELQEYELLEAFKSTDSGLPDHCADDDIMRHARNFVTNVFGSFDPHDILPKHGPGAVATGEKNHEKHRFSRLYSSIERCYPFTGYYVYGMDHLAVNPEYVEGLDCLEAGTAKVVLVPKDSRGPRIISCEPLEYQWIQGGLGSAIVRHLESHPLTKRHVNFTDQNINGRLALRGSKGGRWVTLDMKEASDRVSVALVKDLFRDVPQLLDCLLAIRTPQTRLPNGDVVHMKKFAPMGSNLCFPIEALVFMALGVGCLLHKQYASRPLVAKQHAWRVYAQRMQRAASRLFVYGDDIIATREDYPLLLQYFPTVGLMFNTDKCCTKGSFRESCGVDAFKGEDVTPLRLKRVWMAGRMTQAPETLIAYVSFSNEAYHRGYHRVASLVSEAVERVYGSLPILSERPVLDQRIFDGNPYKDLLVQYGALAWIRPYSYTCPHRSSRKRYRFNTDLQRREVRVHQAAAQPFVVHADDWSMVLRRLTTPTKCSDPGAFTLTRRVTLKRVWLAY
jgi:hypothetical protein